MRPEDQYTIERQVCTENLSGAFAQALGDDWQLPGSVPFLLARSRAFDEKNAVCSLNPYRLRQINWILALECEMRS